MDYMNEQFGAGYALEPVYDAIDDYIAPIKEKEAWGYAIPYACQLSIIFIEHMPSI